MGGGLVKYSIKTLVFVIGMTAAATAAQGRLSGMFSAVEYLEEVNSVTNASVDDIRDMGGDAIGPVFYSRASAMEPTGVIAAVVITNPTNRPYCFHTKGRFVIERSSNIPLKSEVSLINQTRIVFPKSSAVVFAGGRQGLDPTGGGALRMSIGAAIWPAHPEKAEGTRCDSDKHPQYDQWMATSAADGAFIVVN